MIFANKYNPENDTWLIAIEIPMKALPNDKVAVIKALVSAFEAQLKALVNLQPEAEQMQ